MAAKTVFVVPKTPVTLKISRNANPADLTLHQANWVFAKQVQAKDPTSVDIVEVAVDGSLATDFIPAIKTAAKKAGQGGLVVLVTGHGSRAPNSTTLAEFRFETVPQVKDKTKAITKDILDFPTIAEKQTTGWVPKPYLRAGSKIKTTESQSTVDEKAKKWAVIEAMRDAFTTNKTDRLLLLTCSVGHFQADCQQFANLIGTSVVAYKARIASTEIDPAFPDGKMFRQRSVMFWATPPGTAQSAPADPLTTKMKTAREGSADFDFVLKHWKKHPYWSMLPLGPAIQVKPVATNPPKPASAGKR